MKLEQQIKITYEFFFGKFIGSKSYKFIVNEKTQKTINTFIDYLDFTYGKHSVSINILFNWFSFQFEHYSNPLAISSKRNVKIGHIIGPKAVERWHKKWTNYEEKVNLWLNETKIEKYELEKLIDPIESSYNLEEVERMRFLNKKNGLINCLSLTSGFSKESDSCSNCFFVTKCKELR